MPTSLSIAAARLRSLSVTVEPAECVVSEISTVFHEFAQSGWWPAFSASSATRVMKPKASEKSANSKRRRSAPSDSVHAVDASVMATSVRTVDLGGRQSDSERPAARVSGERGRRGRSPSRRSSAASGLEGGVPVGLQTVGELGPAGGDDAALDEDVHGVGMELGEQAAVVRDRQHAEPVAVVVGLRERLDALGAGAQSVDVEPGVELVEDGDPRPQDGELQRLVALLLAAGQVDVERPVEQRRRQADPLPPRRRAGRRRRSTGRCARRQRFRHHRVEGDAGHLGRVLHDEVQPGGGALPHRHRQNVPDPGHRPTPSRVTEPASTS